MVDRIVRSVTVNFVEGARGMRYTVSSFNERATTPVETLATANAQGSAWELVEQHVRAAMGQQTVAERLANTLHAIVEQHGLQSAVGQQAYEGLVQVGLD
jgi:hypothetical protein